MISPKIVKIRKKLDQLDLKLLLSIKKRTNLVNKIVKLKKSRKEVVDRKQRAKVKISKE